MDIKNQESELTNQLKSYIKEIKNKEKIDIQTMHYQNKANSFKNMIVTYF